MKRQQQRKNFVAEQIFLTEKFPYIHQKYKIHIQERIYNEYIFIHSHMSSVAHECMCVCMYIFLLLLWPSIYGCTVRMRNLCCWHVTKSNLLPSILYMYIYTCVCMYMCVLAGKQNSHKQSFLLQTAVFT